jgi:hypothetical protein
MKLERVRAGLACLASLACLAAACTPVSKSYEIHTGEIGCDEANRVVLDAVGGMGMTVTGLKVAKPGTDGYVRATRTDNRGKLDGQVDIRCASDGVHIVADQSGIGGDEFERGVFLSVIGRADLMVEREGREAGRLVKRDRSGTGAAADDGSGSTTQPAAAREASSPPADASARAVGVRVLLEPVRGYATLLDFEANLSQAGLLPVRVRVDNGTDRVYELDPGDIVLRLAGSRDRAHPLTVSQAIARLEAANRRALGATGAQPSSATGPADPLAPSDLGDVRRAAAIIPERRLRAARLRPGDSVDGYLYFEAADYDRARVLMIDAATGETEGFLVEF